MLHHKGTVRCLSDGAGRGVGDTGERGADSRSGGPGDHALIAPLVCGQRPDGVAFLILLSAPGATGKAVWVDQMVAMSPGKHEYGKMSVSPALFEALGRWLDATLGANGS